ncbi:hypothetical protein KI387_006928 [Taxus chinensis]|uniref:CCHC-type domain-containing protein n=1 Tax=Taxus chinensis TaxID=29808 RepID=A0AA38LL62_TAXCH|nr:hypothetical protein KI387_006928 [Taxus chinensis]
MAETPDDERDDEFFKEVYGKEYTGPPKLNTEKSIENYKSTKRPRSSTNVGGESDDDQEERDPNAVPTDFTSREAKVWEAKSKAIERNWKRKKEEEFTCKICGESGHFTQGCPTTLGANRTREFIENIPVKDKRLKPRIIGSGGSVIQKIEKDSGCRIRIEDDHTTGNGSFVVRISGPDRLCLIKGTDAVKKLVNEAEDGGKSPGLPQSRGLHRGFNDENPSSVAQRQYVSSQRHRSTSGSPSRFGSRHRNSKEEKLTSDIRFSQLEGGRKFDGSSSHSKKSPNFAALYSNKSDSSSYQHHGQAVERSVHEGEKWLADPRGKESEAGIRSEYYAFPKTLEELEQDFQKEALDIFGAKSAEEDDEKMKHRERLRAIREAFQKNMVSLQARQMRQWEEFMHREAHAPQRHYQQQLDRSQQVYNRVGSAAYDGAGGGVVGNHGPYGGNRPMEQQIGKYTASHDIYQGPRPDLYGGKAPYNADLYDNPQAFRNYR